MEFQPGYQRWRCQLAKINKKTKGIVWLVGGILHWLLWFSPTHWASFIVPGDRQDEIPSQIRPARKPVTDYFRALCRHCRRDLGSFTECYVFSVMLLSVGIYFVPSILPLVGFHFVPNVWLALLSTLISAGTVIVMLHIVLLQRVFGPIASAERSILLFMCNVVQIVFMFATWYRWGEEPGPLLTSILTFATISHAKKMPVAAMAQIATDFVLLFIFLAFLLANLGSNNDAGYDT